MLINTKNGNSLMKKIGLSALFAGAVFITGTNISRADNPLI